MLQPTAPPPTISNDTRGLGTLRARLRLISGLILFAFVLSHYLNHALGLISLEAMETMGDVRRAIWKSLPGTVLLYGSLLVHMALALVKTVRRRTLRMPPAEALQLGLGLVIPILLIDHVVGTRLIGTVFGYPNTYKNVVSLLWPGLALKQTLLVAIVWIHAMIGLHFWLSYRRAFQLTRQAIINRSLIPSIALQRLGGARRWVEGLPSGRTFQLKNCAGWPPKSA